ncbi:hypothetical protein [Rhizobium sp. X9]|uniref:hypothetical protein n=1 Tax=Rhizobium sp. X9 TaxID=2815360 RepID=UPI001C0CF926|nr:hypothetical protein [Rhizobium sp. X9]
MINKNDIAILMLACRDYEAMEVSLACHLEFGDPSVRIFVLQNCFGDYDAERTLQVARRYEKLYPGRIEIVDRLGEGSPYANIRNLLASQTFAAYSHVIKVDDDAFPVRAGWVDDLLACWNDAEEHHGIDLGYVTPLLNNNCWGFKQIIDQTELADEYYSCVARTHRIGSGDDMNPFRILPPDQIYTGSNGTIWSSPHIARWLHEKTTLRPEFYIEATRDLPDAYVDQNERYSIGAMLFRKELWTQIGEDAGSSNDDEHLVHMYCKRHQKRIVCRQSIPFVHIAYFSQRAENRDIVPRARAVYQDFTGVNYPIAQIADRLLEIEARLRWIEKREALASSGNLGSTAALAPQSSAAQLHLGKRLERQIKLFLFAIGLRKRPVR